MAGFVDILDRPSNSIEKPKPLPVGTYLFMLVGAHKEGESNLKKTPSIEFMCKILQAAEDVDQDALTAALTNANTGEKKPLSEVVLKNTYYKTEAAAWRITEFLDHLGAGDEAMSPRQRLSMTPGKQFLGEIVHEMSTDGKSIFAKIGKTAPVEA